MQHLPVNTRTEISMSMIAINSIESEVDRRKLTFLVQLCNLSLDFFVKRIFLNRLYSYKILPSTSTGFIPDVYRICHKYVFSNYIDNFVNFDVFPSKWAWKRKITEQINSCERTERLKRVNNDIILHDYLIVN